MGSPVIYPEVACVARWWADQLRNLEQTHDVGDAMNSILANVVTRSVVRGVDLDKCDRFEAILATRLQAVCDSPGYWIPDDPDMAGYFRVTATDYGPGGLLADALAEVGIENGDLRLPMKTVVWCNPGKVSVAKGYGAQVVVIYPEESEDVSR